MKLIDSLESLVAFAFVLMAVQKKEERITLYSRAALGASSLPLLGPRSLTHSPLARSLSLLLKVGLRGRVAAAVLLRLPPSPPLPSSPRPTPTASSDAQDENDLGKLARATSAEKGVMSKISGSALSDTSYVPYSSGYS